MENSTEFFKQIQTEFNHALTLMKPPKHKLVGREEELHELSLILNRPETPQVILLGEAGTGKTALASEWAERQRKMGRKYKYINYQSDNCELEEMIFSKLVWKLSFRD
ncbi:ATP-binding protein (plasmid) [Enterococcus faecium]